MPLFVTTDFPPHRGGIQRMISELAREFANLGERVLVVAPDAPGCNAFDAAQRYDVSRYPGRGRITKLIVMVGFLYWARLRSRNHVTIASTWFPSGLAVCCLPTMFRGHFTVLAHGSEIFASASGLRGRLMRYVFARADSIVANSTFTYGLLRRAGINGKISVIYPGVDTVLITPARSNTPTILSVGRLVPRKGFDTMIQAMPAILQRFPTARYEIVGAGPHRMALESLAKRLNVVANVDFLGSLSDSEMRVAYARAWCFSLPVRSVKNDVEGFGMVYLEAALAELPVIGGTNSGAEDAIIDGETGLLVDGSSASDVAAAVTFLLADRERARAMGIRGRIRAISSFTWKRSAMELSNLFETQQQAGLRLRSSRAEVTERTSP